MEPETPRNPGNDEDLVLIPRADLHDTESYLLNAIRRLAATPGVETQSLATDGEEVLLGLVASWARADERVKLWGAGGRPSLPQRQQATRAEIGLGESGDGGDRA